MAACRGPSGKVPSAIHIAPEALDGGLIGKLMDGDVIRVDATTGTLEVLAEGVADRPAATPDLTGNGWGVGRELFEIFRERAGPATTGAAAVL
jgi:phosphogluconate dehydratase